MPPLFDRLRREVGFDVHLLHDVHHRLTPIEAARLGKDLEPYRLGFRERVTDVDIIVDDTPLARMPADEWRSRLAGAFQDFFRFEFRARHTVGVGDVPRAIAAPKRNAH